MLERQQPTVTIERDPDRVEPQFGKERPLLSLADPAGRYSPHLRPLTSVHGVKWSSGGELADFATGATQTPRFDLTEGQRVSVEGDDVELAPARAVVALEDRESSSGEVIRGELLAEKPQLLRVGCALSRIGRPLIHPSEARAKRVTEGSRAVPIQVRNARTRTPN